MDELQSQKIKAYLKKRFPLLIFLTISTIIFFLTSSLLMDDSYKDIVLVVMIWALPLFIH
ncbi:MAG: hypothetical protein MJY99_03960 [Fibrobacter sp.]|nr:hypothetical protein [Fibrobacter sp.]